MTAPTGTPAESFATEAWWLEQHPLAVNTRRTYRVQVAPCCVHLATSLQDAGDPLQEQHAAIVAMRDYWQHRDPGKAEARATGGASTGFPFR